MGVVSICGVRGLREVEHVASADLPSRYGYFRIRGFRSRDEEILAVVKGEVHRQENVLVRLHSACATGDILGSLRCDCREQLEAALGVVGESECGVVIYLPQEGRGIGLLNKLRAYALQDRGLDTVEANHALGFADDLRDYGQAAQVLDALGVSSIRLLTNNPAKVDSLVAHGVVVSSVIALRVPSNEHNARYLETKREKSGHLL